MVIHLGQKKVKLKDCRDFLLIKLLILRAYMSFFAYSLLQDYKNHSNKVYIIFDHTTIVDKFVILQFSLKVGKRAIPFWYKMFLYKEKGNKDFKHVKEGLKFIHEILAPYNFEVIIQVDRGFKSVDLFEFIVYLE